MCTLVKSDTLSNMGTRTLFFLEAAALKTYLKRCLIAHLSSEIDGISFAQKPELIIMFECILIQNRHQRYILRQVVHYSTYSHNFDAQSGPNWGLFPVLSKN